jgi:hypothetical protein
MSLSLSEPDTSLQVFDHLGSSYQSLIVPFVEDLSVKRVTDQTPSLGPLLLQNHSQCRKLL